MVKLLKRHILRCSLKWNVFVNLIHVLINWFRRGFVQGMTHFSVGEEAANVGAVQHLSYDDIFFSNHRGHGQSIAQDMDLNKMMQNLPVRLLVFLRAVVVLCIWLTLKKVTMELTVLLVVVTLLP